MCGIAGFVGAGNIDDLRRMMRREKTLEHLLGKVKINDETPAPSGERSNEETSDS